MVTTNYYLQHYVIRRNNIHENSCFNFHYWIDTLKNRSTE